MDTLSKEELQQFNKWVGMKKEDVEEKIWKKKQAKRAGQ